MISIQYNDNVLVNIYVRLIADTADAALCLHANLGQNSGGVATPIPPPFFVAPGALDAG